MDTAQHAKEIRTALKAKGITSRHVSVRTDRYSMGSTLRVTIKDATVSKETVEAIASGHESVRRDEYGEIMNGGNRYVDVSYEYGALNVVREALGTETADVCDRVKNVESAGTILPITASFGISHGASDRFQIWENDVGSCVGASLWTAEEVTDRLAFLVAAKGYAAELLS